MIYILIAIFNLLFKTIKIFDFSKVLVEEFFPPLFPSTYLTTIFSFLCIFFELPLQIQQIIYTHTLFVF